MSKSLVTSFQPINRHIKIVPHLKKNEINSGVLLPEDYKFEEDRYISATIVSVSCDCQKVLQDFHRSTDSRVIIVDRSMIQEIKLEDKTHHLILENYIVGLIR